MFLFSQQATGANKTSGYFVPGVGGTALYELYRYVPLWRV